MTSWRSLYYEKWVNNAHNYQLTLEAGDPAVALFELDTIIEVWRHATGQPWVREIVALHRSSQYNLEENGRQIFTSYGRGLNDFLNRRNILYFANTAFTLKQGPGETVMKQLVEENAAAGAASVQRRGNGQYDPVTLGLTVDPSGGQGTVWKGAMTWKNLFEVLKEIAIQSSVDFEVLRVGPREFTFTTFYPQRGIDRSGTLTFSPELGNMSNIILSISRTDEANVIAVLGQGEESSRAVLIVESNAQLDSPWNVIETTRDARSQPTLAEMQTTGETALEETKAQQNFTFTTLQTATRQYGKDYNVGDLTLAHYRIDVIKKIVCAKITVSRDNPIEKIQLEFADIAS